LAVKRYAALYIRVSTDAQFEDGYSVEAQQEKLKAYCKLKDIEHYRFYIDGGWSGSNIDRPEMKKMITDITMGKISAVIVYKLDRLSRSQKDTIFLLEDVFNPNDCDFISLNENFDTTSPYGKAMIGILSVFAQLERENIRERTRMGMYERVKSGLFMGGDGIPFGYDYDSKQGILVPNEHAEDVRQIFDLYLKGYSTTRLAKMFDVSSDRHITLILDRITYTGKIPYKGEVFEGKHEAIIDEETFEKVQRERRKRSTKNVVCSNYLLTGLMYCGKCGAKMRYQKWGKKVKIYCYSQQSSKENLIKDPNCDNEKYDAEQVETAVLENLFAMTDNMHANTKPITKGVSTIQTLQERYDRLASKLKRLYNIYAEGEDDILLETIKEIQKEMHDVSSLLEHEKSNYAATSEIDRVNELARNLRHMWNGLTIDEKHSVLRTFIDKIVLSDGNVAIQYNF
jgi:site-specific DNA recombinase